MKEKKYPVIWKGITVGEISNLKNDNFDVYGDWIPVKGDIVNDFVKEIESEGVVVRIGTNDPALIGTIDIIPDDEIEVKIRPNLKL